MTTKKTQLTISLLASDRPNELKRCLESLKPITEKIPCELILIDTSKNPVVNKILREYTDQVYTFEWCKDFAKARNEGLKRAKGEWFMYLDDDEWFVESDKLIDFFRSGEYKKYSYANYQIRNFLDSKYENYADAWVSRLVRIENNTRFVSKIHEYFTPTYGAPKNIFAMVYHSGYIYETQELRQAHFERNCSLLLEMIEEEPNQIRWRVQLAQEYCSSGEWKLLEKLCEKGLSLFSKVDEISINRHLGTFYAGLSMALLNLKQYEECEKLCKKGLSDRRSGELSRAYMHLKLSEVYLRQERIDEALKQVDNYFKIYQKLDSKGIDEVPELGVLLVDEILGGQYQKIAYSILIIANLKKNRMHELREYYEKLGWNQKMIMGFEDIEKVFVTAMWKFDFEPIFAKIIVDSFKNKKWRELICEAIQKTAIEDSQEANDKAEEVTVEFRKILRWFVDAIQQVCAGVENDDRIGYENALSNYVQATCQWYDFLDGQGLLTLFGEENPAYIQAALCISDYFELETKDIVAALGQLKEAVEVFPEFAEGIGSFIHNYNDLEKQRMAKQNEEMENLRIQVIGQVKSMLAIGQKEAATQIVGQLKMMFPEDSEVGELEKLL